MDSAVLDDALVDELLAGAPDFLDLPEEHKAELEKNSIRRERLYWLQARRVEKTRTTEVLVRRAIYAEQRAHDAEMRLAELALICGGMNDEVKRLQRALDETVRAK